MGFARNTSEVAWPGATQGMGIGDDAMYVGVWSALTGGNFLFAVQLSNDPAALALGEVYYIAALGLAIEQTAAANEAQISTLEGLRGKLGAVGPSPRFYAIHVGDPGLTGANESDLARISLAYTDFTYANV